MIQNSLVDQGAQVILCLPAETEIYVICLMTTMFLDGNSYWDNSYFCTLQLVDLSRVQGFK